jgi:hypothetical protein
MFTKKEYEVSRIYILQSSIRQVFVLVKKHNKARYHGERVVGVSYGGKCSVSICLRYNIR